MQRNVWTYYYPGQPLTAISVNHHRNKAPGVSNKIEPLVRRRRRQPILLPVPLQQRIRPQLVQLLLQWPLPAQQEHPLLSQTHLHLLHQQPRRNKPVCSAINRHQETVDLIMEEGRREPIVRTCRTTEDRRGQELLFALRPLLQANCQLQPREWPWHWITRGEKDIGIEPSGTLHWETFVVYPAQPHPDHCHWWGFSSLSSSSSSSLFTLLIETPGTWACQEWRYRFLLDIPAVLYLSPWTARIPRVTCIRI